MAETPLAKGSEPRRLPTMAWVAASVALTAALFVAVVLHLTHSARVIDEPLANPSAAMTAPATAAAAATAPAAATRTQPRAAHAVKTRGRSRAR